MSEADNVQPAEQPPSHKVFAGNLAYAVTEESLKTFFAPVADDILSVQVIMRGSRSAGYGFVTVNTHEAAQKACDALDKKELEGRNVVIEVAKPADQKDKERNERRAKRRAGRARGRAPPGEVTEAEAAAGDAAKPSTTGDTAANTETDTPAQDGKRKNKKKRLNRKKAKTPGENGDAAAASAPATEEDTAAAAAKSTRPPRQKRAPRPAGEDPVGEPSTNMLFVANLGFNVDDAGLSELFTSAGIEVASARIVRRRWGKPRKSKGYGFVDVGGEEQQKKAIAALEGKEVEGRKIAVKVAVNADKDSDAPENEAVNGGASSPEVTVLAQ